MDNSKKNLRSRKIFSRKLKDLSKCKSFATDKENHAYLINQCLNSNKPIVYLARLSVPTLFKYTQTSDCGSSIQSLHENMHIDDQNNNRECVDYMLDLDVNNASSKSNNASSSSSLIEKDMNMIDYCNKSTESINTSHDLNVVHDNNTFNCQSCSSNKFMQEPFEFSSKNSDDSFKSVEIAFDVITANKASPTKVINNARLLGMEFVPTEIEEFQAMASDEEEMVHWDAQYEISKRLNNVLFSESDNNFMKDLRQHENETPKFELSPINLRSCAKNNLQSHDLNYDEESVLPLPKISVASDYLPENNSNMEDKDYNVSDQSSTSSVDKNNTRNLSLNSHVNNSENGHDSSDFDSPYKISLISQVGACDNFNLVIHPSDNSKGIKKYSCPYCYKTVSKLPRHLETVHKDKEEVKKFTYLQKGCKERKEILRLLSNKGNFDHNTNAQHNDGTLHISRRPNIKYDKKGYEYRTCAGCLGTYSKTNIRKHYRKCIKKNEAVPNRSVQVMGRTVEGILHANASDKLRLEVFSVLREDDVVRLVRYDWLIILYGNKLCMKYIPHYQHSLIRNRLRVLGLFLKTIKEINPEIEDIASIYDPKHYDSVVDAIRNICEFQTNSNFIGCTKPGKAQDLVTLIKAIGHHLVGEYIKQTKPEKQLRVENFLKLQVTDMPVTINKVATESRARMNRHKKVVLPTTDDITLLITHINRERAKSFLELSKEFSDAEWFNGIELCAAYLVVFNRRRVGEIQNLLIEDFNYREGISEDTDQDLYNALSPVEKKIAVRYKRIAIRGKKGRQVAVLVTPKIEAHLDLLIETRERVGVTKNDQYLFALPRNSTFREKVVDLCSLMRTLSVTCGAKNPQVLRGTQLRKHIATKCIELELSEVEVTDVANFMGHAKKIHRDTYRVSEKGRDLTKISRLLGVATGQPDNELSSDKDDRNIDEAVCMNTTLEKSLNDSVLSSTLNKSLNDSVSFTSDLALAKPVQKPKKSDGRHVGNSVQHKKRPWTDREKKIILKNFSNHIKEGRFPSSSEITDLKKQYKTFYRTIPQIKSWVQHQIRGKFAEKTVINQV